MHGYLQLVRQGANPCQGLVGDCIGRVGRECGADQRMVPVAVVQREPLGETGIGPVGVTGWKVHQDQTDDRPHAGLRRHLGRDLRVEVHVVEAGHAATQLLQDREPGAVGHEPRVHPALLGGPDVLVEPDHERQVVRQPPHQRHGGVGVGIDQPRDQDVPRQIHHPFGLHRAACLARGQNGQDAPVAHRHRMAVELAVSGIDGQYPLGVDQEVGAHRTILLARGLMGDNAVKPAAGQPDPNDLPRGLPT